MKFKKNPDKTYTVEFSYNSNKTEELLTLLKEYLDSECSQGYYRKIENIINFLEFKKCPGKRDSDLLFPIGRLNGIELTKTYLVSILDNIPEILTAQHLSIFLNRLGVVTVTGKSIGTTHLYKWVNALGIDWRERQLSYLAALSPSERETVKYANDLSNLLGRYLAFDKHPVAVVESLPPLTHTKPS